MDSSNFEMPRRPILLVLLCALALAISAGLLLGGKGPARKGSGSKTEEPSEPQNPDSLIQL